MTNKKKIVVASSLLAIAAAGGVAIGTTTALFTQEATTNIHINAGKLEVGFYVKSIKKDVFEGKEIQTKSVVLTEDYDGQYLTDVDDVPMLDLGKYSSSIEFDDICPTMTGEVEFLVKNYNAIPVEVEVEIAELTGTLASVIEIENSYDEDVEEGTSTVIGSGETYSFTISFELPSGVGNNYQEGTLDIDPTITVTAVHR